MSSARYVYFAFVFTMLSFMVPAAASTKVMVTVDVESYERGNGNPDKQIWGKQPDGEHGIRRIMDLLQKHRLKGVFYLNVYEAAKFGEPQIAAVARVINERGHDLELHTHPFPMYGVRTMQRADFDRQVEILQHGKQMIRAWTGKTVVAHRAGAFAANLDTLRAVHAAGLVVDSSLSPSTPRTTLSHQLPASNLPRVLYGVVELPITFYSQLRLGKWQSLQFLDVESTSLGEFKSVIRQFRNARFPIVNIMMHSFSFVRDGTENQALEQKFDQLLEFLAKEPGIEVVTVSQLYPAWTAQASVLEKGKDSVPYTGIWLTYWRAVEHVNEGGENLMVAAAPIVMILLGGGIFLLLRRHKAHTK